MITSVSMLRVVLCGALLGCVAGCSVNPATGKRELNLVSQDQEVAMGMQANISTQAQYGIYPDTAVAHRVDRIGQRLAAISERPDLAWHFQVLDSPVVNAFALPGGYIYVTRGIMATLNSDAQLAGVLGHEIGHVTARHSATQMTRQQLAGLGLGLGGALLHGFEQISSIAGQGLQLLFLKYSRTDETQADELGVRYVTRAGFDPREMPATYAMLKQMSEKEGQNIPGYLSTHPDPGSREVHTRDLADRAVAAKPGPFIVQANEYKRSLQDLLYGDDPREGYLEGSRFYHPGLHFQLDFPEGWQVENGRATISAGLKGGAAMQLGMAKADASPGGYPAALQKAGKITSAAGQTESIGGYPAWSGVLTLPDGQGGTRQMLAVWIQREAGQLYQFLGGPASDAPGRAAFFASARSLRNLTDPAKLVVYPIRLDIRLADGKSSLFKMLKDVPTATAGESDVAWLNGIEAGSKPKDGFLLKVPRKVR